MSFTAKLVRGALIFTAGEDDAGVASSITRGAGEGLSNCLPGGDSIDFFFSRDSAKTLF